MLLGHRVSDNDRTRHAFYNFRKANRRGKYVITTQSAEGVSFFAPYCRNQHSQEYPDAQEFDGIRQATMTAKRLTCGDSLWSNQASVWADYGLDSQTLIGEALDGCFTRYL